MNIAGIRQFLLFVTIVFAAQYACAAPPPAVRVENFSSFSDKDLSEYLAKNLSVELQSVMRERNLAVFAYTTAFVKLHACFALVGLTEAQPRDRAPRKPQFTSRAFSRDTSESWDASKCRAERLRTAISSMNETSNETLLSGIERTFALGGSRSADPKEPDKIRLSSSGLPNNKEAIFDEIHSHDFSKVFDYRHVQTSINTFAMKLDDGDRVCVAVAGITGRDPDDRNSRWPGQTRAYAKIQDEGTEDDCRIEAAKGAIHAVLDQPWTPKGLLENFSAAREDGIPQPDAKVVAQKVSQLKVATAQAIPSPARATRTKTQQYTTCQNNCVNGDCVRTFPDGRKERFQAQRKYNPFNSDWEWDTGGC